MKGNKMVPATVNAVDEEKPTVATKVATKRPIQRYQPPQLMCVAYNCDNPDEKVEVYKGGFSGAISDDAFVFEHRDDLVRRGYYVHSKTGNIYNVFGVVKKNSDNKYYVLYLGSSKKAGNGSSCYWFRLVDDFHREVDLPGKGKVPRFKYRGF